MLTDPVPSTDRQPADFLLDPAHLAAIVVLVLNDRWWKGAWPGLATGKISDAAGMVVLPLVLVALAELGHRRARHTIGPFVAAAAVTAVGFTAVKAFASVGRAYGAMLGDLRWLITAPYRFAVGQGWGSAHDVSVVHDPHDIWVVPFALVAVWIGGRHRRSPPLAPTS